MSFCPLEKVVRADIEKLRMSLEELSREDFAATVEAIVGARSHKGGLVIIFQDVPGDELLPLGESRHPALDRA